MEPATRGARRKTLARKLGARTLARPVWGALMTGATAAWQILPLYPLPRLFHPLRHRFRAHPRLPSSRRATQGPRAVSNLAKGIRLSASVSLVAIPRRRVAVKSLPMLRMQWDALLGQLAAFVALHLRSLPLETRAHHRREGRLHHRQDRLHRILLHHRLHHHHWYRLLLHHQFHHRRRRSMSARRRAAST